MTDDWETEFTKGKSTIRNDEVPGPTSLAGSGARNQMQSGRRPTKHPASETGLPRIRISARSRGEGDTLASWLLFSFSVPTLPSA